MYREVFMLPGKAGDKKKAPAKRGPSLRTGNTPDLVLTTKTPTPGKLKLQRAALNLSFAETFDTRHPDAYERLVTDVLRGNQTLFMRLGQGGGQEGQGVQAVLMYQALCEEEGDALFFELHTWRRETTPVVAILNVAPARISR